MRDLREKHHLVIDGGYGKIKGKTFRLSNMGDETEETVSHLLACLRRLSLVNTRSSGERGVCS